ncbi:MAG TPA: hypothetical protein VMC42_05150 [Methanoregulaceae archaeon]|nr:hypothetical protein [Methanoregulaceae archaeon]
MMKKMVFLILLITGLYIGTVAAIPVIPEEWYGSVVLDGKPAPVGTVIVVQVNGNPAGHLTTTEEGLYGSQSGQNKLYAEIDDQAFAKGTPTVTFLINGVQAAQAVPYVPGNLTKLDISADSKTAPASPPTLAPSSLSGAVSGSSQPSAGGFPVLSVPATAPGTQVTSKTGNPAGTNVGTPGTSPNSQPGQKNPAGPNNPPASNNAPTTTGSTGTVPSTAIIGILVVVVIVVIAAAFVLKKKGKI